MNWGRDYFFHASLKRLKGDSLKPRVSNDIGCNPDQKLKAVYATEKKSMAIAYALSGLDGVGASRVSSGIFGHPIVRITGNVKGLNADIFVYKLPKEGFNKVRGTPYEHYSLKSVKPLIVEAVKAKDYQHFIRKSK